MYTLISSSIKTLFATLLIILNIFLYQNPTTLGFYNKIIEKRLQEFNSIEVTRVIVLTVSGDKKYLSKDLKEVYLSNYIMHLLVLSGSNLLVLTMFLDILFKRNSFTYYFIKLLFLEAYLLYTFSPHPLARAFIFVLIQDITYFIGLKINFIKILIFSLIISAIMFTYLDYSMSYLLSYYFALSVLIFNRIFKSAHKLLNFLIFNLYMTVISFPTIFIFQNISPLKALFLNILTGPSYEIVVYISYILYFSGLILPDMLIKTSLLIIDLYLEALRYLCKINFGIISI